MDPAVPHAACMYWFCAGWGGAVARARVALLEVAHCIERRLLQVRRLHMQAAAPPSAAAGGRTLSGFARFVEFSRAFAFLCLVVKFFVWLFLLFFCCEARQTVVRGENRVETHVC